MTELSRALLSSARDGLQPDAATMARVRAKVAAVTAAPAASTTAAPAQAPTIPPMAVKLMAIVTGVALVALVGVTISVMVVRSRDATPAAAEIEVATLAQSSLDLPVVTHEVLTAPNAPPPVSAAPAVSTARTKPPVAVPVTLAREVELVDRAMLQLRRGAPDDALAELAIYRRETRGHGQLAEDAAAIDIEARCRLGRDVSDILPAFDRRWPTSAQRARLADACDRR